MTLLDDTVERRSESSPAGTAPNAPDPAVKVLTLHRAFGMQGGVEKYFFKIKEKYIENVDHYFVGRRPGDQGALAQVVRLFRDYCGFAFTVVKDRYTIVQINPSIEPKSFIRNAGFHLLARILGRNTVVFVHGWHTTFQPTIDKHPWAFRLLYGRADAYVVLSNDYRELLRTWGITGPIYTDVTIVDEDELRGFDVRKAIEDRLSDRETRILFAARVTAHKGIYELLDAVSLLQQKHSGMRLIVAGDSAELNSVKQYAASKGIRDTVFAGWVEGKERERIYKTSHLFCLPTYYEGFPQAVVEAMALGLPVVTRAVGGLRDFFQNEVHGFITESKDPAVFADFIERLVTDRDLYRRVSMNNYQYAQEHFLASQAASRMEKIYRSIVHGSSLDSA